MTVTVEIVFQDSILDNKQPEELLHPFLLVGCRKGYDIHLISAKVK